jgi:hypothetical protein
MHNQTHIVFDTMYFKYNILFGIKMSKTSLLKQ